MYSFLFLIFTLVTWQSKWPLVSGNGLYFFCRDCFDALNHGLATSFTNTISFTASKVHLAILYSFTKFLNLSMHCSINRSGHIRQGRK